MTIPYISVYGLEITEVLYLLRGVSTQKSKVTHLTEFSPSDYCFFAKQGCCSIFF